MSKFLILDEVRAETTFEFEGERLQFGPGTFVVVFGIASSDFLYALEATDSEEILKAIFLRHVLRGYGFVLREKFVGLIEQLEIPTDK